MLVVGIGGLFRDKRYSRRNGVVASFVEGMRKLVRDVEVAQKAMGTSWGVAECERAAREKMK